MHTYGAEIDRKDLRVSLRDGKRLDICFYGQRAEKACSLMFAKKAVHYCVRNIGVISTTLSIHIHISAVCQFKDVSPEKLSRLPPQGNIDFHIKLVHGA